MSKKETSAALMVVVLLFSLLSPISMVAVAQNNESNGGFLERVIGNTIDIGLKVMPADMAANLTNYVISTYPDTIAGLLTDLIPRMDAKASADAVNTIVKDMNTKDLSKFLTTFLNRLDAKALGNMLNSMMKDNAGTLGGFSAKFVENLDAASTGNLVSELIDSLDAAQLGMFTSELVDNLDSAQLGIFTTELTNNLDAAKLGKFSSGLVENLDAAQLGMFTSELVDNLDADLVGNFSATLVDNLNAEPMGSLVNAVISKQEVSAFVLDTMDYIDNQELIGLINDVFGKTFKKNYAITDIIIPSAHITSMTIILPESIANMLGLDSLALPVAADADIALSTAYITNMQLAEYPLPPEAERLNK